MRTASVSTIRKILRDAQVNPHRITYYCEKRDPNFDKKMHDVLVIYKQLELRFDEDGEFITGKIATLLRDYEYERLGTLSLLAAIDLLTGEAVPLVSETHKSSDFITFLQKLDEKYPKGDKIRLILDNHSAHTSMETQGYLNTVPGRFEFVFTPTHGSWLNMIEGFFSKMTRQMLTGIRVVSKEELTRRIYLYFEEINQTPIPYKWKYQMDDIDLENEDIDNIVYEVVNAKAASCDNKGKRAPIPITRRKKKADTTC